MCPVLAQVVRFTENFKMSLKLEKKGASLMWSAHQQTISWGHRNSKHL